MMTKHYSVYRIAPYSICHLIQIERILYECGKNMAEKEALYHWNNSHLKNAIIVVLCILKNKVFLVMDGKKPVATFQIKVSDNQLWFMKLATMPAYSGCGIGSFCIGQIEQKAISYGCHTVCCEVYERSKHAIEFYERTGYVIKAKRKTLKYTELIMEKVLGE